MNEPEATDLSRHRRAWDAIPWVVNGSADAAERRIVEAHVAGCADCRAELAFQRGLHAGMADAAAASDPGPVLQCFWRGVDVDAARDVGRASSPLQAQPLTHATARPRAVLRWLAAAVVVQAIGLAVVGGMLWERPRVAGYETLSLSPAVSVTTPSTTARIRLVPAPSLTLGELRALLARCGVQLADSSADGTIFGLVQRPGATGSVADAVARLRAEPGVLLAEPIAVPIAAAGSAPVRP